MSMSPDIAARNATRKQLAQIFTAGAMLIIVVNVVAYLDDGLCDRAVKLWPVGGTLFAAIMVFLGHYTKVGSDENREIIKKDAPA